MARRAGSAFNRHDKAAIRASIEVAMEMGHARCFVEYGGLRIRFDLDGGVGAGSAADEVIRVGGDGSGMEVDVPAGAPASAPAGVDPPTSPVAAPADAQAKADAARVEALEKKAAVATERRRRQKKARRQRDEAARLLAAQASSAAGAGDGAQDTRVHCPLWSATVGQGLAMFRLLHEVTERCSTKARDGRVLTKAVEVHYGGRSIGSCNVLSGSAAVGMTACKRGEELLALLGSGLTEERLSTLLNRWAQAQER